MLHRFRETNWPRHSFSEPLCNNGMLISPLQLHLDLAPHNEWINFSIAFFSLFLWLNYTHFPRCARFQNHFLSSRASSSWMSPQDSEAVSVLDPSGTWLVTLWEKGWFTGPTGGGGRGRLTERERGFHGSRGRWQLSSTRFNLFFFHLFCTHGTPPVKPTQYSIWR